MVRWKLYPFAVLAAAALLAGSWALRGFLAGQPSYAKLEEYTPSLTTRVYDMHGEQIAQLSIERRALLSLAQIPGHLRNAVIATEDSRFFAHGGIDPRGILRAALRNFRAGRVVEGGSTLTQQLAKLIFLSRERKIVRKLREAALAVQIERNLSKEEIFQIYLNQIYFGTGAYGVEAAAHIYFGKEVEQLTLAESAMLAGLIKSPETYSPFKNPKLCALRRRIVLGRMEAEGFITKEEAAAALESPLPDKRPGLAGISAPYFVESIRRELEPKYGYDMLWKGGLTVHSTLDMRLQRIAEEETEKALTEFDRKAYGEWEKQLAEDQRAGIEPPTVSTSPPEAIPAAFVLLDVKTGAVRAMIGGRGADDRLNRAVQARRQPGSTFKPFVFAAAFNEGLTAMTLVEDKPLAYYYDGRDWRLLEGATDQYAITLATAVFSASEDFGVWVPTNYDDKYMGVITLRSALALSRNMVSVRLIEHVGPPKVVALAHRAGVRSRLRPVLSLGLGTSEVSPLELANAFETLANGGIHVEPYSVVRVQDRTGRILEHQVPREREALSPQTAYLINHLLKVVVERGTGRAASVLKRPLAGKTGTTNENKDLWFVGYTPDMLAVAWMGYDDSTSLGSRLSSGSTLVPWWAKIMGRVLEDYPSRDFQAPDGVSFQEVDSETGYLALPTCPRRVLQAFRQGTEPAEYCPFDHTKPLELQASFRTATDMERAFLELEEDATGQLELDGDGGQGLPSEDELQKMTEVDF